jgi:hypothetical protein
LWDNYQPKQRNAFYGLKNNVKSKHTYKSMETWQAIIKEIGNKELLKPIWVSSEFDYIKDDKRREWVTRNHLENFWGLRDDGVEWYTLERIDDNNKQVNQVTAFMLYIYNRWGIQEAKLVFGDNLGEHIFDKYLHHRNGLGELFWYSELDNACRRKLVERAIEFYDKE